MNTNLELDCHFSLEIAESEWMLERGLLYAIKANKPDVFEWLMKEVDAYDEFIKTGHTFEQIENAEVDYRGTHYISFTLKKS